MREQKNATGHGIEAFWLGQTTLRFDGDIVSLSTRKALALIVYLTLEGPTERSRLSELLWTDLEGPLGRGNLRRELYRLRVTPLWELLDIGTQQLGFRTELPTDVATFQAHVSAGRLNEALALYRGPLLGDLSLQGAEGFETWLTGRRQILEDAYHETLARHASALEAQGDLRGALAAQVKLVRADELQERAHRETMRLHALLGERGLALTQYRNLQTILTRELGLEPLPETAALAARVRAEGHLDIQPTTLGSAPPLLDPPLVGRTQAWILLSRSPSALSLITAEPGVGKTRLAEDFARSRGATVLIRGLETASNTPLTPVADALRNALDEPAARARLEQLDPVWRREAGWLVPELDSRSQARPPSSEGRSRFLEGLTRAIGAAAGPGGTVILDDFQWCDASTVEVALHLVRLTRSEDFRVIITARPTELATNQVATRTLASVERDGQLQRLKLEPLSDLDVLTLVRAMSGGAGAQRFSRRLHAATGGNPLYILETLRSLFASGLLQIGDGGWSTPFDEATDDYAELPLPPSVRAAVVGRVDMLGGGTRRLLELASLMDSGFQLADLAGASALTEWEELDALERALSAHLITSLETGYRFSHELLRRALEDALGPERRRLSHWKLADNLTRSGGAPSQIAAHFERAQLPAQAAVHRLGAARAAARIFAHQEALGEYARALHDGLSAQEAVEVHLARAELLVVGSDYTAAEDELTLAQGVSRQLADAALDARVTLAQVGLHNSLGRYGQALDLSARLMAAELPARLRARTLYEQGTALLRLGRLGEAEPCLQAALLDVPEGAPELTGQINTHLQACAMQRGDLKMAQTYNAAALQAFRLAGSRMGLIRTRGSAALLTGLLGEARTAARLLEGVLEEAREIGDVGMQRTLLLNLFKFLLESGDLEAAVPRLEEGLALARSPQDPYLEGVFLNNLGVVQRLRGNMGAAVAAFYSALELADQTGIVQHQIRRRITLAEQHLDLGDPVGAQPLLDAAREFAAPTGLGEVRHWLETLCARCDLVSGDPSAAVVRLRALLDSGDMDADDHARITWMITQAYLALETPQAALLNATTLDLPATPLLRGWALSLRLEAQAQLGHVHVDDVAAAQALLDSAEMFPLESLALQRALIHVLQTTGEAERALEHLRGLGGRVRDLAASLEDFPGLRRSFLTSHRDVAGVPQD